MTKNISEGLLESDLKITSAMLSDSMDKHGHRDGVLPERLVPNQPGLRAIGRARTAQFVPSDQLDPEGPYDQAIDFIDSCAPGDILVIATNESNASAFWGELFSAAAMGRGAAGLITDGNLRDSKKVAVLGFAAFSRSNRPIDFRGRMVLAEQQISVVIGGVTINPGDLVCADQDGIVVVPKAVEADVLHSARQRAVTESTVLTELLAGSTLREVWIRHGIL
jgi:4-hydroxy-4-methyl-2-oxoglutarate aldolase